MKVLIFGLLFAAILFGLPGNARGDAEQALGNLLFTDPNLSLNRNQSCATCHSLVPATNPLTGNPFGTPGFVDPVNVLTGAPVSAGSAAGNFGALNAPSAGYAAFSPDFFFDNDSYAYIGGQFWNGRAANLEAQAAQPLLNPAEMALPSQWAVVTRLRENTNYVALFQQIYGWDLTAIPAGDLAPATATPPAAVPAVYAALTQAIAQFERGPSLNRFTSKYDYYLAGRATLSADEKSGLVLFTGRANCANCHLSFAGQDANGRPTPPLFTDFTYANVGLPRNWNIPGAPAPDPGLGGRPDIAAAWPDGSQLGLHKVMSLRNVAITPPYGHNGVLTSLPQVVHFYNTRDVLGKVGANTNSGFGITGWAPPETTTNLNRVLMGNLRLTAAQEAQIVAFLGTLTDNYPATGGDPNVPPGTPSPFASAALPSLPVRLGISPPANLTLTGRLGQFYRIDYRDSLAASQPWQSLTTIRLLTNGQSVADATPSPAGARFYRAEQLP